MKEIILIKVGEIALKGLNKHAFESVLIRNLRRSIAEVGEAEILSAQCTLYVMPKSDDFDMEMAVDRVGRLFGISRFTRACETQKEMDAILRDAVEYLRDELEECETFKVEAKRADKKFPLKSPEICAQVGERLLDEFPHLRVDVHNPDVTVMVEIRDFGAYIHGKALQGAGGIPVGTGGRAGLLISGGIDSPVAAWTIAKRGVELFPIHFASPPYTSERAEQKVIQLLQKVSLYSGKMILRVVPFTEIQEEIVKNCPEDLFTIIMRRYMMKLAERIAEREQCEALITGESLGQVASQTMQAIGCTNAAVERLPVLRPLIGMDKEEIVTIARKIDTFEISIEPYEDCCTVFTPRHPRTKPVLANVIEAESKLDEEGLIERAIAGIRRVKV